MPSFSPFHLPVDVHEPLTEWREERPCSERRLMDLELGLPEHRFQLLCWDAIVLVSAAVCTAYAQFRARRLAPRDN
jgi:hypothetical protein